MTSLKQKDLLSRRDDYRELLAKISSLIEEGRKVAVRQVNTALVATYWLMGRRIVEYEQGGRQKAGYGEELLVQLAQDLTQRFGKGFSKSNLFLMRAFYLANPPGKIFQTVSGKSLPAGDQKQIFQTPSGILQAASSAFPLSWSHYSLLMRVEEPQKRAFYERLSLEGHWSVRQLDREITSLLYERTALSKRKEIVIAKAHENPIVLRPEDEVKDSYVLDFLGLKNEYSESDLEDALIRHIENFLLELGRGFTFVARQRRFFLDGDEYRIDLLLYNIPLACYVICEIKVTKFTHANAGQINFYVNWAKENILPRAQNDPIGIILCSDKNNTTVRYATGGLSNKIFVSKYLLELPKPEELQRELERGRNLFLEHEARRRLEVKKALPGVGR